MKTTHAIIDEIAGHYNLNNRSTLDPKSTIGWNCQYNGPDGKHCAFAYMCIDPSILVEGKGGLENLVDLGENILKLEFRGHDFEFYQDIQFLHDIRANWTDTGLSEQGIEKVKKLKLKWPVE